MNFKKILTYGKKFALLGMISMVFTVGMGCSSSSKTPNLEDKKSEVVTNSSAETSPSNNEANDDAKKVDEQTDNKKSEEQQKTPQSTQAKSNDNSNKTQNPKHEDTTKNTSTNTKEATAPQGKLVWQTKSGKKYHSTNHCGKTDFTSASQISLEEAQQRNLTPCSKCF